MAPPSGSPALSGQIPSITSSSPTSTTSQKVSSQAAASSVTTSSRANSPSFSIPASTSIRSQTHSTTSSTSLFPSPPISATESSQIPSLHSTDARVPPLLHRPGIIAAIFAPTGALFLLILLAFFLYRRRRARQKLDVITSRDDSFLQYNPGEAEAKGWKDSARSTAGEEWAEESPPRAIPVTLHTERAHPRQSISSLSGKGPHYTVRSRTSTMSDVYGFGQDVAWKEVHYEDPLPAFASPNRTSYPPIDITPPTPSSSSGIIHHNMGSAVLLLRAHSAVSSISSQYSTASMTLPDSPEPAGTAASLSPAIILDQPRSMENREFIARMQEFPLDGSGARQLV
ncbi:hypothetical protein C8R44DRAFT_819001 [Mycena epipterygia]|nr:hypothetical protein C8R44DRAFT_819001 [Mycena epipterygia]